MSRRKRLVRLLFGAAAVGAGIIGLRASRDRGPDSFLPSAPMPPTPDGEAAAGTARLPKPEPVPDPKPLAKPETPPSAKAEPAKLTSDAAAPSKPKSTAKPKPAAKPKPKPKAAAKPRASAKPKAPTKQPVPPRSREELYREAKKLGIEGRSKMSKGELERAIAKASS